MGRLWFQGPFFRSPIFPYVLYLALILLSFAVLMFLPWLLDLLGVSGE